MLTQATLYSEMESTRQSRRKEMTKATPGANVARLRLTLRDIEVLEAIYTARYMTVSQLQALFWRENRGGQAIANLKACQRRMRQLHAHGLVRRIEPLIRYTQSKKSLLYAIDQRGAHLLSAELGIDPVSADWKPQSAEENYPFLQHLLATTDVRIAFTQACAHTGVQLETWRNERELKSEGLSDVIIMTGPDGKKHKAAVVPDALICFNHNGKRGLFLVEIDRRSVTVTPSEWEKRGWSRKARQYIIYFESDAYKQRYNDQIAHILIITTGETRLSHLKEATENVGGGKRFWFTTYDELSPQRALTAKIWRRAGTKDLYALLG